MYMCMLSYMYSLLTCSLLFTCTKEFYFKCAEHDQRSDGGVEECCVALHMVRVNTVNAPCAACFSNDE